jgi:hypothetical protein
MKGPEMPDKFFFPPGFNLHRKIVHELYINPKTPILGMEDSMILKRTGLLIFLVLIPGLALRASGISLLVIETGRPGAERPGESSLLWENGVIDACFDAGHIVTNAPILRLEKKPAGDIPGEARRELDEAARGGMEYLIIALLDYKRMDGNFALDRVSLTLFKTLPYRKIFEQAVSPLRPALPAEEQENARRAALSLISHIEVGRL